MSDNALRDNNAVTTGLGKGQVDTTGTYNLVIDELTGGLLVAQAGTWSMGVTVGDIQIGAVEIKNATDDTRATVGANGLYVDVRASVLPTGASTSANQSTIIGELQAINSLVPDSYDYISLSYTGDNLTGVVFKSGGSGGTTISTLTLAYTGSQLDSVTKT